MGIIFQIYVRKIKAVRLISRSRTIQIFRRRVKNQIQFYFVSVRMLCQISHCIFIAVNAVSNLTVLEE